MRDSWGNLCVVVNSVVDFVGADVAAVVPATSFIYSSYSNVSLDLFDMHDMSFSGTGGLMVVTDTSHLSLKSTSFRNISSSEQGVIYLKCSTLLAHSLFIAHYNATFVHAETATIALFDLHVTDGVTAEDRRKLALQPDGGFLSCEKCPKVTIANGLFEHISAREGGVLYLTGTNRDALHITKSKFAGCKALTKGGVASISGYRVYIDASWFEYNTAVNGGVVYLVDIASGSSMEGNEFRGNYAASDGACVRWEGARPALRNSSFTNNTAAYGNPMASTPRYLQLLDPSTLLPTSTTPQGVTGQQMQEPLTVGVFDELGQLIATDQSSVLRLTVSNLTASGNLEVIMNAGVANFSVLLSPFTVGDVRLTIAGDNPDIEPYALVYSLRDCRAGEIRKPYWCIPCAKNSYSLSPEDSACQSCILHAECLGRDALVLSPQYWRSSTHTDEVYDCLSKDACLGGIESACKGGYAGVLCGACAHGYYKWAVWTCEDCDSQVPAPARAVVIAIALVCAVSFPSQFLSAGSQARYRLTLVFRLLVEYAQTMAFVQLIHIKWSFGVLLYFELLSVVGTAGSVLLNLDCHAHTGTISPFHSRLIATALYPLLFLAAAVVVYAIVRIFKYWSPWRVPLSLALAVYHYLPIMLLMAATALQCTVVDSRLWLVVDTREECFTSSHWVLVASTVIPMLILVAFAYIFSVVVVLRKSESQLWRALRLYLVSDYRFAWWELLTTLRWVGFSVLVPLFPQLDRFCQTVLFYGLVGAHIALLFRRLPHTSQWVNSAHLAAVCCQYCVLVVLLCAASDFAVPAALSLVLLLWGCGWAVRHWPRAEAVYVVDEESGEGMRGDMRGEDGGVAEPPPSISEDSFKGRLT